MKQLPIPYCSHCGAKLKQIPLQTMYDVETGEPYNYWLWICPNKRLWNFSHAKFKTDENGDTFSFYNPY